MGGAQVHHCLSSLKSLHCDTTRLEGNIQRWKDTFMIFYLHGSQIISKKSDSPRALLKEVLKAKLYFWELLNVQCNAMLKACFRFQKQEKGIVLYGHGLIWAWSYIFTDLSDQVAGATVHLFPNLWQYTSYEGTVTRDMACNLIHNP